MGLVFGRWLLASVALGAIGGGAYGVVVASTLGSPDEVALVSEAPVALVLGIGLGLGSLFGIVAGVALGTVLGLLMGYVNAKMTPSSSTHYIRRVRVVAVLVPFIAGVAVLLIAGRVLTLDVLPVAVAAITWGLAARRIAEGYRGSWPVTGDR